MSKKVAFIGLGIMGSRMASNLAKHNVNLAIYNRDRAKAEELGNKGVTIADSIDEAVQDADIVFSMLSTPEAITTVFLGEEGALNNMKPGSIWADCTTVNPSFSKRCHFEAKEHNVAFVDAPVEGSKPQAENAELIFFLGGKATEVVLVFPLGVTYLSQVVRLILA